MNPAPFILYRDQLLKLAACSSPAPSALNTAPPAAASGSAVEIDVEGVVVRVPPGADAGLLTEVVRAVRRSAHALGGGGLAVEGGRAPRALPSQHGAGGGNGAAELARNGEAS